MFNAITLAALVLALSLTACKSIQERKKETALDSTLYSYHTAMRWGRWDTLLSYRGTKAPEVPEVDLDNIRVTGYEVRQPPVPTSEETVFQVVEIQYVLRDSQRLRKLFDEQEWRFDAETRQWRLFSPFPDFR